MSFIVGKVTYDHDILRHHFFPDQYPKPAYIPPPPIESSGAVPLLGLSRHLLKKTKCGRQRKIMEKKNEILGTDVAKTHGNKKKNIHRLKNSLAMAYNGINGTASPPEVLESGNPEPRSKFIQADITNGIGGAQDMRNGPLVIFASRRKWRDIITSTGYIVTREVLDVGRKREKQHTE
ncbi:hypothetical protein BDD12DRAFT_882844 [Trichophaea hybrida]|nr:hypothetical protein BDD12DRAFT_882844 [Trichophaea hybrida]